jgi:hypothetical protein
MVRALNPLFATSSINQLTTLASPMYVHSLTRGTACCWSLRLRACIRHSGDPCSAPCYASAQPTCRCLSRTDALLIA